MHLSKAPTEEVKKRRHGILSERTPFDFEAGRNRVTPGDSSIVAYHARQTSTTTTDPEPSTDNLYALELSKRGILTADASGNLEARGSGSEFWENWACRDTSNTYQLRTHSLGQA